MLSRGSILALFTFLLCVTSAVGQSDRGSITGRVTDPNGAGVANAKVTATNLTTAETREVKTSDDGNYTIPELKADPYKVTAEAPGFKRYVHDNVTVEVAGTTTLDPVLELGQVTEQVGPEPGSAGRYQQQCSGWSCRTENGHGSSPFQPQFHSNPQPLARCQLGCSKCGRVGS